VAVEGDLDAAVVRRLITQAGLSMGPVYGRRGKDLLDKGLRGYNNAARHACWLVLRDLDHDAGCAPELVRSLMPEPSAYMRFRVAVRQVEAWLLADRARVADLFQVSLDVIPPNPETLDDAKWVMVQLARRSRNRRLREEIVPEANTSAKVGPGYTARMIEFATNLWRPQIAKLSTPSLASCLRSLERWKESVRE
ncbi:MAG TPA: hypothetical protein VIC28_01890, partial [Thermoanaerobaculia bacterium]